MLFGGGGGLRLGIRRRCRHRVGGLHRLLLGVQLLDVLARGSPVTHRLQLGGGRLRRLGSLHALRLKRLQVNSSSASFSEPSSAASFASTSASFAADAAFFAASCARATRTRWIACTLVAAMCSSAVPASSIAASAPATRATAARYSAFSSATLFLPIRRAPLAAARRRRTPHSPPWWL